jgi:hypothetical protein
MTFNNLDALHEQPTEHETFALRWSITLFDVQLGLIVLLNDNGLRLDVKCGTFKDDESTVDTRND